MALEIKIASPTADGFVQEIKWNADEIATEVEAKIGYYKNLVYNDTQIQEAKKDRAQLNKFIAALKAKDREIKDLCLAPYEKFHNNMEKIISLVEEPVEMIDKQVNGFEDREKKLKQEEIEKIFRSKGFAPWTTLERIWNPKWLNKTFSLKQIDAEMTTIQHKIGEDILTINQLQEGSRAALSEYKQSMDLNAALAAATRFVAAAKAEEVLKRQVAALEQPVEVLEDVDPVRYEPHPVIVENEMREKIFKVFVTREQLAALNRCLKENKIEYRDLTDEYMKGDH